MRLRLYFYKKLFFLIIFVFLAIIYFGGYIRKKFKVSSSIENVELSTSFDVFIHSIYYFKTSRTLGRNAVAIIATSNHEYFIPSMFLNKTHKFRITKSPNSGTFVLHTNIFSIPKNNYFEIETSQLNSTVEIKFIETVKYIKNPVMFCINPQVFETANSEALLEQFKVAKKLISVCLPKNIDVFSYGANLHVYLMNSTDSFYNLLKNLKTEKIVSFQFWALPPKSLQSKSDPFSQTASTSDCLYRFKESAQFIGFLDLGDILIPYGHSNYYSEFSFEIGGEWLHNYLVYQKLYVPKNVSISKKQLISDSSAYFARPDHFNITKSDWNSVNEYISQFHFEKSAESPKEVKINEVVRQSSQLQKFNKTEKCVRVLPEYFKVGVFIFTNKIDLESTFCFSRE